MDAAADVVGNLELKWQRFEWGCDYYLRTGQMMPDTGLNTLAQFDAIYLGAIGTPGVPDHLSLWGLLPIRQHLTSTSTSAGTPPARDRGPRTRAARRSTARIREHRRGQRQMRSRRASGRGRGPDVHLHP